MNTDNQERISALSDEVMGKLLKQEGFRNKTLEHIKDYVGKVEFMEIVQKYADQQIDKRIYKNIIFWISLVFIPVAVTVISTIIIKSFFN